MKRQKKAKALRSWYGFSVEGEYLKDDAVSNPSSHAPSYVAGSKVSSGDPAGLITRSQANNGEGVVYVAINYRLGAFGWLSGSTLQENGTANAGLHDQRMALEWVQKNIHLFGGDPSRVTVLGQSAGAGSIMHQITVSFAVDDNLNERDV